MKSHGNALCRCCWTASLWGTKRWQLWPKLTDVCIVIFLAWLSPSQHQIKTSATEHGITHASYPARWVQLSVNSDEHPASVYDARVMGISKLTWSHSAPCRIISIMCTQHFTSQLPSSEKFLVPIVSGSTACMRLKCKYNQHLRL